MGAGLPASPPILPAGDQDVKGVQMMNHVIVAVGAFLVALGAVKICVSALCIWRSRRKGQDGGGAGG